VAIPWAELSDMTGDITWAATLSTDGEDQATCPAPGDDFVNPDSETLSR
jgi:hypothetical protein